MFNASMNTLGTSCRRTIGGVRGFLNRRCWAFTAGRYLVGRGKRDL